MTDPLRAPVLLAGAALLAAVLTGCSGGGFGTDQPAQPDTAIRSYVALGDGFTAAPYVGKTVDKACRRSDTNYPAMLAAELDVEQVTDVSCTGVGTRAITHRTKLPGSKTKVPPQVEAVDTDTDLVTIGVGIEDDDLLHRMFDICVTFPCRDPETRGQTFVRDVARMGASLAEAVRAVQKVAPQAEIVLVGYPQITPVEGRCKKLPDVDRDELDAVNTLLGQVNGQIRSVAQQTGASYVDVAELSDDHDVCAERPWVNGEKDVDGASVAFHPREPEQAAVAGQIEAMLGRR